MNKSLLRFEVILGLVLLAAFSRLIPHPPNLTAIGALALFSGSVLSSRWIAALLPLAALFLTDLVLGLHATIPFVYLSFILVALMGPWFRELPLISRCLGGALASSTLFFVVSNFGVWLIYSEYAPGLAGLAATYTLAIPFYLTDLVGTSAYAFALFGAYEFAAQRLAFARHPA